MYKKALACILFCSSSAFPSLKENLSVVAPLHSSAGIFADMALDLANAAASTQGTDQRLFKPLAGAQLVRIVGSIVTTLHRMGHISESNNHTAVRSVALALEGVNQLHKYAIARDVYQLFQNPERLAAYNEKHPAYMKLQAFLWFVAGVAKYLTMNNERWTAQAACVHAVASLSARHLLAQHYQAAYQDLPEEEQTQQHDTAVTTTPETEPATPSQSVTPSEPETTEPEETGTPLERLFALVDPSEQQTAHDLQEAVLTRLDEIEKQHAQALATLTTNAEETIHSIIATFEKHKEELAATAEEKIAAHQATYQTVVDGVQNDIETYRTKVMAEKEQAYALIEKESKALIASVIKGRDEAIVLVEKQTAAAIAKLKQEHDERIAACKSAAENDCEKIKASQTAAQTVVDAESEKTLTKYASSRDPELQEALQAFEAAQQQIRDASKEEIDQDDGMVEAQKNEEHELLEKAKKIVDDEVAANREKIREEFANAFAKLIGRPLTVLELKLLLRTT